MLPKRDVAERLDVMLRRSEATLQRLRGEARGTAGELHLRNEFQRLDTLIGTLLGSREPRLESPVAVARAAGWPYDPERLDLVQRLHTELAGVGPVTG